MLMPVRHILASVMSGKNIDLQNFKLYNTSISAQHNRSVTTKLHTTDVSLLIGEVPWPVKNTALMGGQLNIHGIHIGTLYISSILKCFLVCFVIDTLRTSSGALLV